MCQLNIRQGREGLFVLLRLSALSAQGRFEVAVSAISGVIVMT
jgi:hypothetical protein